MTKEEFEFVKIRQSNFCRQQQWNYRRSWHWTESHFHCSFVFVFYYFSFSCQELFSRCVFVLSEDISDSSSFIGSVLPLLDLFDLLDQLAPTIWLTASLETITRQMTFL